MSIKEGDMVEYVHLGETFSAVVQAVLWVGGLKARVSPAVKGHPTTWPVKKLRVIKEEK